MKRVKFIFSFILLFVFIFCLSSCGDDKDDFVDIAHMDIKITKPVDSQYTQPERFHFTYNKYDKDEWLEICYKSSENDEVINISPQYGGYEVRYYSTFAFDQYNNTAKKMIFPDTIKSIDGYVFSNFQNLEEVVISKSIDYISPLVFCHSTVKKITIDEKNKSYEVKNDALYQKESGCFVYYLNNSDLSQYNVCQASDILDNAFFDTNLTSIVFEEGVKRISSHALDENTKLTSITLPSTFIEFVESYAFGVSYAFKDPETGEWITKDDPRFKDFIMQEIISDIKKNNPNLNTIYSHINIDYDFSKNGIEFIKI